MFTQCFLGMFADVGFLKFLLNTDASLLFLIVWIIVVFLWIKCKTWKYKKEVHGIWVKICSSPLPPTPSFDSCGLRGMILFINLNDILVSERAALWMANNKIKAFNLFSPPVYLLYFVSAAMFPEITQSNQPAYT